MAAAAGVPVHLIPDMDYLELATAIRGYRVREYDMQVWTRWMVAALLQPHVGKGKSMKPTDLISLGKEAKEKANDRKSRLEMLRGATEMLKKAEKAAETSNNQ